MKTDYTRVVKMMKDALQRFATGTYVIWYPSIARLDAQELPRKLWNLSIRCKRPWLHCSLDVGRSDTPSDRPSTESVRPGLSASGLFVINPPYTLHASLKEALPELVRLIGRDSSARFSLDAGE